MRGGETTSFASKRELPYFFSNTQRDGNGRDAFICRLPLKWTVSITREEHVLYIIFSSEYKSSWKKTPVSGVLHDDWSQSTECGRVQLNTAL